MSLTSNDLESREEDEEEKEREDYDMFIPPHQINEEIYFIEKKKPFQVKTFGKESEEEFISQREKNWLKKFSKQKMRLQTPYSSYKHHKNNRRDFHSGNNNFYLRNVYQY